MRRIDADELIKTLNSIKYIPNGMLVQIQNAEIDRCISFVETAPTVDDKTEDDTPAGKWIPEEKTFTDLSGAIETYTRFKCDRCLQGQDFGPYPFCPWCGKKMNQEITKGKKDEQNGT